MLSSPRSLLFSLLAVILVGSSHGQSTQPLPPADWIGDEIIIQYTLKGESMENFRWGGTVSSDTGINSLVAAAMAIAIPDGTEAAVDTENQIIKIKLRTIASSLNKFERGAVEELGLDMQAARIIQGRDDLFCVFFKAGRETSRLHAGKTLNFRQTRNYKPVERIVCEAPPLRIISEFQT